MPSMLRLEANISDLSIQTLRRYAIGQQGNLLGASFVPFSLVGATGRPADQRVGLGLRRGRLTKSSLGPRMLTIGAGASNFVMSTWQPMMAAMWRR